MQLSNRCVARTIIGVIAIASYVSAFLFWNARTIDATTPINRAWQAKYVEGNPNKDFRFRAEYAECKVCHVILATGRIERLNGYGNAVKKFITKAEIAELETDQEKVRKYIDDGLKRAGLERNSSGLSFQDLFDQGKRPWEEPD